MINSEKDIINTIEIFEENLQTIKTLKNDIEEIKHQLLKYKEVSETTQDLILSTEKKLLDTSQQIINASVKTNNSLLSESELTFSNVEGITNKHFEDLKSKLALEQEILNEKTQNELKAYAKENKSRQEQLNQKIRDDIKEIHAKQKKTYLLCIVSVVFSLITVICSIVLCCK